MKYLVAYYSKTGTTEEIAEKIGEILRTRGEDVTVSRIAADLDVQPYDRLVVGGPINGMKPAVDTVSFLKEKAAGKDKPIDIFIVSYLFERGRPMWQKAVKKSVGTLSAETNARSTAILGGRLPSALPPFARFMFGTPKDLPLDIRDWKKIEEFAQTL
jgi:menaquinone-dependent protoporphyrinogen oxidase